MKFVLVLFVAGMVLVAVQAKPCKEPEKPDEKTPETKIPDGKTPKTNTPDAKAPDTKSPDGGDDGEATAISFAQAKGKKATAIAFSSAE